LKNISLSLKEGEWLGIFGRTGAGKSTLVKLLPRLLDPPEGTVFVDGTDVRHRELRELRSLFAVAPQDSQLFSDTIAGNIFYGAGNGGRGTEAGTGHRRPQPDFTRLPDILRIVALERDVAGFRDGTETIIGEKGVMLSGGQKQRISIARALVTDSRILILDDSLSALDVETEQKLLEGIFEIRRDKTTIIISHRVCAFRNANKVAVLEDGAITACAPPGILMLENGFYAKTALLQDAAG